jgi:hypothetical protein
MAAAWRDLGRDGFQLRDGQYVAEAVNLGQFGYEPGKPWVSAVMKVTRDLPQELWSGNFATGEEAKRQAEAHLDREHVPDRPLPMEAWGLFRHRSRSDRLAGRR